MGATILKNMFPVLPLGDSGDGGFRNAKFISQHFMAYNIRNITLSNLSDLLPTKDCEWGRFLVGLPALRDHIRHVAFVGVQIKMFGVHAMTNIAVMADKLIRRNWAVMQFVRNHVSAAGLPFVPDVPVSARHSVARPQPTAVCLINFLPESHRVLRLAEFIKTGLGAIEAGATLPRAKGLFAALTQACYFLPRQDEFSSDENEFCLGSLSVQPLCGPFCILAY